MDSITFDAPVNVTVIFEDENETSPELVNATELPSTCLKQNYNPEPKVETMNNVTQTNNNVNCSNKQLDCIADHLLKVIKAYNFYESKNFDSIEIQKMINYYYDLSYVMVEKVILPRENDQDFIKCILHRTVEKSQYLTSYDCVCSRFNDMLEWTKSEFKLKSRFPTEYKVIPTYSDNVQLYQITSKNKKSILTQACSGTTVSDVNNQHSDILNSTNIQPTSKNMKNSVNLFLVKVCGQCFKRGTLLCSACLNQYYCSASCQIKHRATHQNICKALKLKLQKELI